MTAPAFVCAKLKVGDLDRLEAFYTAALGCVVLTRLEVTGGDTPLREVFFAMAGSDRPVFALLQYVGQEVAVPGEALLAFMVDDLEAAIAAVEAHGGTRLAGPIAAPEWAMRLAFVADPGGHRIELMQSTASPRKA